MLASCGSMWNINWAPQVNCAVAEEAGIYWGKKYTNCWNNSFLTVQIYIYIYIYVYIYIYHTHIYIYKTHTHYIYVCIYDSEQTVVISPMQHLHFPDQQG